MLRKKWVIILIVVFIGMLVLGGVYVFLNRREPGALSPVPPVGSPSISDFETDSIEDILSRAIPDSEKAGLLQEAGFLKIQVNRNKEALRYMEAVLTLGDIDQELRDDTLYRAISIAKAINDNDKAEELLEQLGQQKYDDIQSGKIYGDTTNAQGE
jgi:hypothetical protein